MKFRLNNKIIQINTLEELLKIVNNEKRLIILKSPYKEFEYDLI